MYKKLFISVVLGCSAWYCTGQQVTDLRHQKLLQKKDIERYNMAYVLLDTDESISEMASLSESRTYDKLTAKGILQLTNLEWENDLQQLDQFLLQEKDIARALGNVIIEESLSGVSPIPKDIESLQVTPDQKASLYFHQGYQALQAQELHKAQQFFAKTISLNGQEIDYAYFYSGIISLLQGSYKKASEAFEKVSESKLSAHTRYYHAASLYAAHDYENLLQVFSHRSDFDSRATAQYRTPMSRMLGYAAYKLKHYDKAISQINSIRDKNNNDLAVLSDCYSQTQNYDGVLQLQASRSEKDGSDKIHLDKMYAHFYQKNYREALKEWQKAYDSNEYSFEAMLWNKVVILDALGQTEDALKIARQLGQTAYGPQAKKYAILHIQNFNNPEELNALRDMLSNDQQGRHALLHRYYALGREAVQDNDIATLQDIVDGVSAIDQEKSMFRQLQAQLALLYYQNNNTAQAYPLFQSYVSAPDAQTASHIKAKMKYYLAYRALTQKELSNAKQLLADAINHYQQSNKTTAISKAQWEDAQLRLADLYLAQNQIDMALSAFQKAKKLSGAQRDYATYQIGLISLIQNNTYDHIIELQDFVAEYPNSEWRDPALQQIGQALLSLQKYHESAITYRQLLDAQDPALRHEAMMQLGLIAVNAGDYAQAASYYQKILDSDMAHEYHPAATKALQEIYADYDFNSDAYATISHTKQTEKSKAAILLELGVRKYDEGEYDKSINTLTKIVDKHTETPEYQKALYHLALAFESNEEPQKAVENYITFLEQGNDYKRQNAESNLWEIMQSTGDYKRFLPLDKKGIWTQLPDIAYYRIVALIETQQIDKALDLLQNDTHGLTTAQYNQALNHILETSTNHNQWELITQMYKDSQIAAVINNSPKNIYTLGLAYVNTSQAPACIALINEQYSTLGNDAAWLAKSMILQADAYFINNNKDMAVAVLEGLLASKTPIPPSLRKEAQSRLDSINL